MKLHSVDGNINVLLNLRTTTTNQIITSSNKTGLVNLKNENQGEIMKEFQKEQIGRSNSSVEVRNKFKENIIIVVF